MKTVSITVIISHPPEWTLPRSIAFCCRQNRKAPSNKTRIAATMRTAANGIPSKFERLAGFGFCNRASWATTTPSVAKADEVLK